MRPEGAKRPLDDFELNLKLESNNHRPTAKVVSLGRYKRIFDLTILVLAHVLLLPLWLLLWTIIPFLIWLGDGRPIFYKQKRTGKNGRVFILLKFRTMIADAELKGPPWTMEKDPRVTRVGKILRRTALDELPEIINIWKGDMSLVGPRALDVDEQQGLEKKVPGFAARLRVLPGLTGLSQVYDRNDTARGKFRYDLEYIQHMGPWLDLKLLILSVRNTLGAQWDRRDGKTASGTVTPDSLSQGDQQDQLPKELRDKTESTP